MRALLSVVCGVCCLTSLGRAQDPATSVVFDPREVPIPPIATGLPSLPDVTQLPTRIAMPDVMTMNDGTKVTTQQQWQARRDEMRRILSHYAVGHSATGAPQREGTRGAFRAGARWRGQISPDPPRVRSVRTTRARCRRVDSGLGWAVPRSDPARRNASRWNDTATAAAGPNQGRGENVLLLVGPVPFGCGDTGCLRAGAVRLVRRRRPRLSRPSVQTRCVVATRWSCSTRTTVPKTRRFATSMAAGRFAIHGSIPAYPGYDWGILAGWAWGASRIADYLEPDSAIEHGKLIITGASRYGKVCHGRGSVRRSVDGRARGHGRRRSRRISIRGSAQERDARSHGAEVSELVLAELAPVSRPAREVALRPALVPGAWRRRGRSSRSKATPTRSRCPKPCGSRCSAHSLRTPCSAPPIDSA